MAEGAPASAPPKKKKKRLLMQAPMKGTTLALVPAALFGIYNFGWRAALVIAVSFFFSIATEYFFTRRQGKPVPVANDRSFVDRDQTDPESWYHNIHYHGIGLIVMTAFHEGEIKYFKRETARTGGFPIERLWADQRPDLFELIFTRPHARIYRVR